MNGVSSSETYRGLLRLGLVCWPLVAWAVNAQQPAPPRAGLYPPVPAGASARIAQPSYQPLTNLVFDQETQVYYAKPGETVATFTFQVTNVSEEPVHILDIQASCHCTQAEMPSQPWILSPHTHEPLHVTMQLMGKPPGENVKVLTITSTNGMKQLWVKSIIPAASLSMADREKNLDLAKADRQAVFRGDCAVCHVDRSKGLMGAPLYREACGICHDSDHRATMVPELSSLKHPTDANFWRVMITEGKDKTLMPAFALGRGGPLTGDQIDSLVAYLTTDFPREHKPTPQIQPPAAAPRPVPLPHAESRPPSPANPSAQIQWLVLPSEQARNP